MPQRWYRLAGRPEGLRLFCLPFAGGGAATYRPWQGALAGIEIVPLELPGRERRFREPAHRRMADLVAALVAVLEPNLAAPYALFGHSMGALVAYELARAIEAAGLPAPRRLFASACRPPFIPALREPLHGLPDAALIEELRRFNGTPAALLDNPELMAIVLPTIRADLELVAGYPAEPRAPIGCPVTALGGDADRDVPAALVARWSEVTTGPFDHAILPGDHFFIGPMREQVLAIVAGRLLPAVAA